MKNKEKERIIHQFLSFKERNLRLINIVKIQIFVFILWKKKRNKYNDEIIDLEKHWTIEKSSSKLNDRQNQANNISWVSELRNQSQLLVFQQLFVPKHELENN